MRRHVAVPAGIAALVAVLLLVAPTVVVQAPWREETVANWSQVDASVATAPGDDAPSTPGVAHPNDASSPSSPDQPASTDMARLLDVLTSTPGLESALASADLAKLLATLDPANGGVGSLQDLELSQVLQLLARGEETPLPTSAPPLPDALRRWAEVSGASEADPELAQGIEMANALPAPLAESVSFLVEALSDAELARQAAFAKVAPDDLAWLTGTYDPETASPAEQARAQRILAAIDMDPLTAGASRLWRETERQLPLLRTAAATMPKPLDLRDARSPDERFDQAIAALASAAAMPSACTTAAEAFAVAREGDAPLPDSLTALIAATGGTIDAEASEALATAGSLPLELQQALSRVVDAYVFGLRESVRAALQLPASCADEAPGGAVASLALLHAMKAASPALAKWSLVIRNAQPYEQAGQLRAFTDAQHAAVARQDGSAASAIMYAAWQGNVPLAPPTPIDVAAERPLENAVLNLYAALGLTPTQAERALLAEDAGRVAPWLQVHAARILLAQADAIAAMRAPTGEAAAAFAAIERDAAEAEQRIASPTTTWADVAWLETYYANVEIARKAQQARYQAAFDLAHVIDTTTRELRALDLASMPGATSAAFSVQSASFAPVRVASVLEWLRALSPIGSAAAQTGYRPADADGPPNATLPPGTQNMLPTGSNDVIFRDPMDLVILGGVRFTAYHGGLNPGNPGRQILTLDLGGDDTYASAAGGATTAGQLPIPVAVAIDLGGKDRYDSRVTHASQGAALAAPVERTAHAQDETARRAFSGALGILVDYQGDDVYSGPALSQGAAAVDTPSGFALGLLLDGRGNDTYVAAQTEPLLRARPGQADADLSGWQGFATGWLPPRVQASVGVTTDGSASRLSPSSVASFSVGLLFDTQGSDRLVATRGQGAALVQDPAYVYLPQAGNMGLQPSGAAITTFGVRPHATGALLNSGGNDTYVGCASGCQGSGGGGLGVFAELGGADAYSATLAAPFEGAPALRGNDRTWLDGRIGLGIDVDAPDGKRDEDRDGLPAFLEELVGSSDQNANDTVSTLTFDTDADGYADDVERLFGTDPEDGARHPVSSPIPPYLGTPAAVPSGADKIIDLGLNAELSATVMGITVDADTSGTLDAPIPRLFALGSTGPTTYERGRDYALVIDLGGGDLYENNAGGNIPFTLRPFDPTHAGIVRFALAGIDAAVGALQTASGHTGTDARPSTRLAALEQAAGEVAAGGFPGVVLAVAGDDVYRSSSVRPNQGGAEGTGAVSLLVDLYGDDSYTSLAQGVHQGAAASGATAGAVGMLLDLDGRDRYRSPAGLSQGSAQGNAIGFLVDANTRGGAVSALGFQDNTFEALQQGYANATALPQQQDTSAATGVLAAIGGGRDTYRGARPGNATLVQGSAFGAARGVFLDVGGKDVYVAATGANLSHARNDVVKLPPYPPETNRTSIFADVEDGAVDTDGDDWPDLVEALAGTNASRSRDSPVGRSAETADHLLHLPNLGIGVGHAGDNAYERNYRLLVDLGGNNTVRGNAGGAHASTALMVVLGESYAVNEFIEPAERRDAQFFGRGGVQGGARLGIAVAVVDGGTARFNATDLAQGAGDRGVGILALRNTRNVTFNGTTDVQGASPHVGIGILWNDGPASNDSYDAWGGAQAAAGYRPPAPLFSGTQAAPSFGLLYDGGGTDRLRVANGTGQAFAANGSAAALLSAGLGDTSFHLGRGYGQAYADGGDPRLALALLVSEGGDDRYLVEPAPAPNGAPAYAQAYAQGAVALLLDGGGNDAYEVQGVRVVANAQGVAYPIVDRPGFALLADEAGRDRYVVTGELAQGVGWRASVGIFLDWGADDAYRVGPRTQGLGYSASGGSGAQIPNPVPPLPSAPPTSSAIATWFLETFITKGDYRTRVIGWANGLRPGSVSPESIGETGLGLYLDLGGWDRYESWDGTRATPFMGSEDRQTLSAVSQASCHGPGNVFFNGRGNDGFWAQGGGWGADVTGTNGASCAAVIASKTVFSTPALDFARGSLPYKLEVGCQSDLADNAVLAGATCARLVRTSTSAEQGEDAAIDRVELHAEPDARTGRESVSQGIVFLGEGDLAQTDPRVIATFAIDTTKLDDGYTWLLARVYTRRDAAGSFDVLRPVVVDNVPRALLAAASPGSFDPERSLPTALLQLSRDVPGTLGSCATAGSACQRARAAQGGLPLAGPRELAPNETFAVPPFGLNATKRVSGVPLAPVLAAQPAAGGGVDLEWTPVPGALAYVIHRGSGASNPFAPATIDTFAVGWASADATRVIDRGVGVDATYWYFVSPIVTYTPPPPGAVAELHAPVYQASAARSVAWTAGVFGTVPAARAEPGDGWVLLEWLPSGSASAGAPSYRIERWPEGHVCRRNDVGRIDDAACRERDVTSSAACATTCRYLDTDTLQNNRTYVYRIGGRVATPVTAGPAANAWSRDVPVLVNPGAMVVFQVANEADGGIYHAEARYVAGGAPFAWTWPGAEQLTDGRYVVTASPVEGRDGGRQGEATSAALTLDRADPVASIGLPRFVNAQQRVDTADGAGVMLTWRLEDALSPPRDVSVARVVSPPGAPLAIVPWLYRAPADVAIPWRLAHGETASFIVLGRDAAGNEETLVGKEPQLITADYVAPVLEHVSIAPSARPGDRVPIVVEAKDRVSGVAELRAWLVGVPGAEAILAPVAGQNDTYAGALRLDVPASAAGHYAVVIRAVDVAGNVLEREQFILVDAKPPTLVESAVAYEFGGILGAGRPGGAATLRILAVDDDAVGSVRANTSRVSLANESVFSRNALTGWFEGEVRFDRPELADGQHAINVSIADRSGNVNTTVLPVEVDARPVAISGAHVVDVGPTWARLRWNTTIEATSSARWGLDRSSMRPSTEAISFTKEHDHVVDGLSPGRAYLVEPVSRTRSGILAPTSPLTIETLPAIGLAFAAPVAGEAWSGVREVRWTAAEDATAAVHRIALSDGVREFLVANVTSADTTMSVPIDTRLVPDGQWRVVVTSTRGHAEARSQSALFTVDNTAPRLRLTSPAAGAILRGPALMVEGVATDAGSRLTATLQVGGATFEGSVNGSLVRAAAVEVPPGEHTLVLTVRDAAGNVGVERVGVVVDPLPPGFASVELAQRNGLAACAPPCELTLRLVPSDPRRVVSIAVVPSATVEPIGDALTPRADGRYEGQLRVLRGAHGEQLPIVVRVQETSGHAAQLVAAKLPIDLQAPVLRSLSARPAGPSSISVSVDANEPVSLRITATSAAADTRTVVDVDERRSGHAVLVEGLRPDLEYDVLVTLRDAAGNGAAGQARASTLDDVVRPTQVRGLQAALSHKNAVVLEWPAASDDVGVATYRVYRSLADESGAWGEWTLVGESASLRLVHAAPAPDRVNLYGVRAVDWAGSEGPMSPSASVLVRTPLVLRNGSVSPESGPAFSPFTFRVLVSGASDPTALVVQAVVNGAPHTMERKAEASCRVDCLYEVVLPLSAPRLGEAEPSFSFLAVDGATTARVPDEGAAYPGPLVVASDGLAAAKIGVPLVPAALGVIVAAIAATFLAGGRRWRK